MLGGIQTNHREKNVGERENKQEPAQSLRVLDLDQTQGEAIAFAFGVPEVFPYSAVSYEPVHSFDTMLGGYPKLDGYGPAQVRQ